MGVIKKLLLFCFFLNFTFFFGQEKTDLSQLSFESLNDTITKYALNNLTKGIEATNVYILKAKKEKDKKQEWKGIYSLGRIYERHQEFDKAQIYYEQSLSLAEENNLQEEIVGSYSLGANIQLALSNASKAMDILEKALKLAEEIKSEYWEETVLQFISYALQLSGDTQKAIEIRKKFI